MAQIQLTVEIPAQTVIVRMGDQKKCRVNRMIWVGANSGSNHDYIFRFLGEMYTVSANLVSVIEQ